jgi:hypothetical protein
MATVINNPAPQEESGGTGFMVGMMFLLVIVAMMLYWGIPALRSVRQQPAPSQINVPDKIDVNINKQGTQ